MEPYFSTNGRTLPTTPYLQVAALPDLQRDVALGELVTRTHELLAQYPTLAVLPKRWLHVTMQAILHCPATDISDARRARLVTALSVVAAGAGAFTLQAGSVLAGTAGVVADLHPDDLADELFARVRSAVRSVLGEEAVIKDSRPAHMALAYARGEEDSGRMQSRLRRCVRPSHAPLTVAAIHLVEVTPDPEHALFRWRHLNEFPLRR